MSQSPWIDGATKFFSDAHPLFSRLKMRPIEIGAGEVLVRATLGDVFKHRDTSDHVHNGTLTIIADTITGFAVITKLEKMQPIATISLRTEYIAKAHVGDVVECRAACYAVRGSVAFARSEVILMETGQILATSTGAFMIGTKGPDFQTWSDGTKP